MQGELGVTNSMLFSGNAPLNEELEYVSPAYCDSFDAEMCPSSVGNRQNLSPLLRASCWGFEDVVKQLVDDGADVYERDVKGETALHKAARFGHLATAIALLRSGCELDVRDNLGMTPLHWAALNGNAQLSRLLLLHQADTKIRDHYAGGMTAKEMAELMGHNSVLRIMEKYRWASE